MYKSITSLIVVGILAMSSYAFADGCDDACVACPSCKHYCCKLDSKASEKDKHCWKVECKPICVPNVVFPWQKPCKSRANGCTGCDSGCCDSGCCNDCNCNNGACVIKVKVLKKHKYTCPSCKYSWTPVEKCCATGCCASCCDGHIEADDAPVPAVAPSSAEGDVPPTPPAPSAKKTNKKNSLVAKVRSVKNAKIWTAALKKVINR